MDPPQVRKKQRAKSKSKSKTFVYTQKSIRSLEKAKSNSTK
jgi:hypothetical protein